MRLVAALLAIATATPPRPAPVVHVRHRGRVIDVRGEGFGPGARLVVEADVTWPHASVACVAAWRRAVVADRRGRIRVRLAPRGECAFSSEPYRVDVSPAP